MRETLDIEVIGPIGWLSERLAVAVFLATGVAACISAAASPANALPAGTGRDGSVLVCSNCGEPAKLPVNNGSIGGPTPGSTYVAPLPPPPAPSMEGPTATIQIPIIVFDPVKPFSGSSEGSTAPGGFAPGSPVPNLDGLGDLSPAAGGDMAGEVLSSSGGISASIITCVNNLLRDWDNPAVSYECHNGTN